MEIIEYHITDRCNLNCKSCIHFCPLCKKSKDKNIYEIKYDFLLLKKIEDGFNEIHIFGGEPFLHNDLIEICKYVRKLFPDKYIQIITNGTIYISDDYINIFKELNIRILISIYPFINDWKNYYTNLINMVEFDSNFVI